MFELLSSNYNLLISWRALMQNNNIAVDIGFGSTKFMTQGKLGKFPSAIARLKNSQADIAVDSALDFNGKKYLVGDNAIRGALTTKDYSFLEQYSELLLYNAFCHGEVNLEEPINLVTGLSLLHWNKRNEFASKLSDFIVDKNRVSANVRLVPQGKGIYLDYLKSNPHLKGDLVLVVDIGYNTLDVIPFEGGKALANEAWATSQGINLMVDEIRKQLSKEYNFAFNESRANEIMQKKSIALDGEERDISLIVESEKENYNEIIINEIKSRNSDMFRSAKAIILAGGGAYYAENFAKNVVHTTTPYEYSNVRGYFHSFGSF